MEMQSHVHPTVAASTSFAIMAAVKSGPDGILMGTRLSEEATLMLVPPMSMTRTFMIFRIRAPRCKFTGLSSLAFQLLPATGSGLDAGPRSRVFESLRQP